MPEHITIRQPFRQPTILSGRNILETDNFTFKLYKAESDWAKTPNAEPQIKVSTVDEKIEFATESLTSANVYRYIVEDNLDGTMKIIKSIVLDQESVESVEFTNIYKTSSGEDIPSSPKTGDSSNINLWIALFFVSGGSLIGAVLYGKRKEEDAE